MSRYSIVKQIITILVLSLTTSGASIAQNNITLGKPYGVLDARYKEYFSQNEEILTIKIERNEVHLQKLDASTLTLKSVKSYADFPKEARFIPIVKLRDRYLVFYSLEEGKDRNLYFREVDFSSGTFKGEARLFITVKEPISGTFNFLNSYDDETLLIEYRYASESKDISKSFDQIGMHVFDNDLNEKWSDKVKMPYSEKKMDNLDYAVDSQGNVYIVCRVYKDNSTDVKKKGEENTNYHLEILKVTAGTATISSTKIEVEGKFPQSIWLFETEQSNMIGVGLYNKGDKASRSKIGELKVEGFFLFDLNSNSKASEIKTYEIPVEILTQNTSKKEAKKTERKEEKDEALMENIVLTRVTKQKDGSLTLIAEQRYLLTKTPPLGSTAPPQYFYNNNDILISKISASGSLLWMKKLPKRQVSFYGHRNLDFAYTFNNNEHSFYYLDNVNNLNLLPIEEPAQHIEGAGGYLTRYIVNNETGNVSKSSILDTRNVKGMPVYQFGPYRMLFTSPETIVFEAYKKKKEDILVKVVLE